jgi:hypothetical protein
LYSRHRDLPRFRVPLLKFTDIHHRSSAMMAKRSSLAANQKLLQQQHWLQFQPRFAATAFRPHASFRRAFLFDASFATASASPPT